MTIRTALAVCALVAAMFTATPAQAAPNVNVSAKALAFAAADATLQAPAGAAAVVTGVKVVGGAIQVNTAPRSLVELGAHLERRGVSQEARAKALALHVTGQFYNPHETFGYCFGYWHGDAQIYGPSGSGHWGALRTFFSGPSYQNKKCASTVQSGGWWGVAFAYMESKLQAGTGTRPVIAGPHNATRYYTGPTWSTPNITGCVTAHGAIGTPSFTRAVALAMDC